MLTELRKKYLNTYSFESNDNYTLLKIINNTNTNKIQKLGSFLFRVRDLIIKETASDTN